PPRPAEAGRRDAAHQHVVDTPPIERRDDLAEHLREDAVLRAAEVFLDVRVPVREALERDADGMLAFHHPGPCKPRAGGTKNFDTAAKRGPRRPAPFDEGGDVRLGNAPPPVEAVSDHGFFKSNFAGFSWPAVNRCGMPSL